MTSFPLYDNLLTSSTKDLTVAQKTMFIKNIKKVNDTSFRDNVYILIRLYHHKNTSNPNLKLPYEGVIDSNDLTFDLEKFPNELKRMLYKFLNIHMKTARE